MPKRYLSHAKTLLFGTFIAYSLENDVPLHQNSSKYEVQNKERNEAKASNLW